MLMLDRVRQNAHKFDILHFHIDHLHFPTFRDRAGSTVTTLHGRQDLPDSSALYFGFDDMPLISISDSQRRPIPKANFSSTIHHGLPDNLLKPTYHPRGGYLAFLGRITPEKGPDKAIEIARSLGIPLKIAAKVDKVDEIYFREIIQPLLTDPSIEFVGEIGEHQKARFLGEALALLFPIDWPEPFGLVMIEAMACGTPVVAFNRGSVTEIIEDGITGAIVDNVDDAILVMPSVLALDRRQIRERFNLRFSASRMVDDHIRLYEKLLKTSKIRSVDAFEDVELHVVEAIN